MVVYLLHRSLSDGGNETVLDERTNLPHDCCTYLDTGVTAGAMYRYLVEASTGAGADRSPAASITMPTATPSNIPVPHNITVMTSRIVYIQWSALQDEQVDQYKVVLNPGTKSQLITGAGPQTYALIDNLEPYGVYKVSIQACYELGGCGTGPKKEFQTFPDVPQGQAPPQVESVGQTYIELTWKPPERPNGKVSSYRLYGKQVIDDTITEEKLLYLGADLHYVHEGLKPFSVYMYRVSTVVTRGVVSSEWVSLSTSEVTPELMLAPVIESFTSRLFLVAWQPPLVPNGNITHYILSYNPIPLEPSALETVTTVEYTDTTAKIFGLQPFTKYQIWVTAFNKVGNVTSEMVHVSTKESSPQGMMPVSYTPADNGVQVDLLWEPPTTPNGIIRSYSLYSDMMLIYRGLNREFSWGRLRPYSVYSVRLEACTTAGCTLGWPQRVTTAEVAPEQQPQPEVTAVTATSAWLHWLPVVQPNGVLLRYELWRTYKGSLAETHASEAELVYSTTNTPLTLFEFNDTKLLPYCAYEYAVKVYNTKGSTVSSWLKINTSQALPSGLKAPVISYIGSEIKSVKITWKPPQDQNGVIHMYLLQRDDTIPWSFLPESDYGFIDSGLKPDTEYYYTVSVCNGAGCVQSRSTHIRTRPPLPLDVDFINISASAYSLTAVWEQFNSSYYAQKYELFVDHQLVCAGLIQQCVMTDLEPYTIHSVMLRVCSVSGCVDSDTFNIKTQEALPGELSAPLLAVLGATSAEIHWSPPVKSNGLILGYEVRRNSTLIQATDDLGYVDYELQPGTTYSYIVSAYNSIGHVESSPSLVTTDSSIPTGLHEPIVKPISYSAISVFWQPPLVPNGQILKYSAILNSQVIYTGLNFNTNITGLQPFTKYSVRVIACTSAGCGSSTTASVLTLEAVPLGLGAPSLTPLADLTGSHTGVLVMWDAPTQPNGIIQGYKLYRKDGEDKRTEGRNLSYL